jgi:hypothetical protein
MYSAVVSVRVTMCSTACRKFLKPGIDCARLPREAVFVALRRKVHTMLPCENLARVELNRSGFLSRGKGISVCCAPSVETVLCLRDSVTRLPRFDAPHEHGKKTNEFAAHEQLPAAAECNRYPALQGSKAEIQSVVVFECFNDKEVSIFHNILNFTFKYKSRSSLQA